MAASYPSSAKSFTTKNTGDTIQASHVGELQEEVTAIEQDLIAGLPVSRGGTGNTTITANRVLLGNGTSAVAVAGAGTAGQFLKSNGASAPTFGNVATEETTTATGAENNFDLDAAYTVLRCTGAAPVFSGFTVAAAAPSPGDQVILECLGTTLKVTHQDTNSTDVNRVICASTNGQIVGANGRILLVYDGTTDRWRASVIDPGAPIAVAHSAGNFTASAGDWTVAAGDQTMFTYQQRGKLLTLIFTLVTTTVSATPASLRLSLLGFTATRTVWGLGVGNANVGVNAYEATPFTADAAATFLQIKRANFTGASWEAVSDTVAVAGSITLEVD